MHPLRDAAESNNLDKVRQLVEKQKFNVDAVDKDERTALMIVSQKGHLDVAQYLVVAARAKVEAVDKYGWTALIYASRYGHLPIVRVLVETARANVEAVSEYGKTVLMYASEYGRLGVVQFLVESGRAKVHVVSQNGCTALDLGKKMGHHDVVAYLQQPTSVPKVVTPLTLELEPAPASVPAATPQTLTTDQHQMKQAVDGAGTTFAASESYVQLILTDTILGRGFFGTVFRGFDCDLECSFAVKAINAEILAGGTVNEIQRTKKSFEKEQQVRLRRLLNIFLLN